MLGFRVMGVRVLGFWGFGFLGFGVSRVWGFGVLGLRVFLRLLLLLWAFDGLWELRSGLSL